jgi:hypothetical protein
MLLDAEEDILGKEEQVTRSWRKLHTQKLHNIYSLPDIIEVIKKKNDKMDRICVLHRVEEICIQAFGGEA